MRRLPAAARWCAVIAFANAMVWTIVTPPFHVPDETVHVSYLQYLAETGRIPNKPGAAVFSPQEAGLLDALAFNAVVGSPRDRTAYTAGQQRGVQIADEAERSRVSGGGTAESSSQPPLFYAYEAIGYLASPWRGLLERVWLMRLMSALLCAATVVFVYLFLRELLSWAGAIGGRWLAFRPGNQPPSTNCDGGGGGSEAGGHGRSRPAANAGGAAAGCGRPSRSARPDLAHGRVARGHGQPAPPEVIAREIVEDLTAALAEFEAVAAALEEAAAQP